MDRIVAIHKKLPNCHLVMHGSSSVPQDLQDELRKYRRRHEADLGRSGRGNSARHQARVRKINVDTMPHRHHRRHSQGAQRNARQIRPSRLSQTRPRSHEKSLHRPHDLLRPGWPSQQMRSAGII